MSDDITLCVQSDDFGMCHAVNEGIVQAFTQGILTQSTCMVPCPWFDEAAALAQQHAIPVGMHSTLTAEWDHLRWRPLTDHTGLRGTDGTFHRSIQAARANASVEECKHELEAQVERILQTGVDPTHFDCHMGVVHAEAYEHICRKHGKRFLHRIGDVAIQWDSRAGLSERPTEGKLQWLCDYLEQLGPGRHLLVAHCGVASPELAAMAAPYAYNYLWTQHYRIADLHALVHPKVREIVDRRGIRLAAVRDLD